MSLREVGQHSPTHTTHTWWSWGRYPGLANSTVPALAIVSIRALDYTNLDVNYPQFSSSTNLNVEFNTGNFLTKHALKHKQWMAT